ncbi:uncharacterized protein [Macrobrachium rosenbergii]|uniref:uncharacterized protein n=1 Tax=Macrobrachium rosenbergii TaxID=79674 RepID=UPI0034D74009
MELPSPKLWAKIKRTAAYNPEAIGIIEQFHSSLKVALTVKCQDGRWRKELPWILLGLRKAPHAAFNVLPVEALYRQSLADFFQNPTQPTTPSDVRRVLKQIMSEKRTYHAARKVYMFEEICRTKFAFIRVHTHRPRPPQPPTPSPMYFGPHRILQHRDKCYQMSVVGRTTWVSTDRLKTAYIPENGTSPRDFLKGSTVGPLLGPSRHPLSKTQP